MRVNLPTHFWYMIDNAQVAHNYVDLARLKRTFILQSGAGEGKIKDLGASIDSITLNTILKTYG